MIRPNLRRFLSAALALLAAPGLALAQYAPAGPPTMYAPQCPPTPQLQHQITGDYSLWDESRPIERFFSETVQQSWLRLLNIDHHQYLSGTAGSMAPGMEDAGALAQAKARQDYWANRRPAAAG